MDSEKSPSLSKIANRFRSIPRGVLITIVTFLAVLVFFVTEGIVTNPWIEIPPHYANLIQLLGMSCMTFIWGWFGIMVIVTRRFDQLFLTIRGKPAVVIGFLIIVAFWGIALGLFFRVFDSGY